MFKDFRTFFCFRKVLIHSSNFKICSSLHTISRENFIPFDTMVQTRRNEAKKSVVLYVPSWNALNSVTSTCLQFGKVQKIFEHKSSKDKCMYLVEFEEEGSVKEMIDLANSHKRSGFPTHFPVLKFFRDQDHKNLNAKEVHNSDLEVIQFLDEFSHESILKHLRQASFNLSDQLNFYYEKLKMDELGWRLRFLTCRKIECVLPGVLSDASVLPFGSSVNTFGKRTSDLDMVVDLRSLKSQKEVSEMSVIADSWVTEHTLPRRMMERQLQCLAELVSLYVPSFTRGNWAKSGYGTDSYVSVGGPLEPFPRNKTAFVKVFRILHANVPIIKFTDLTSSLDCDVTIENKSGYEMSALLYHYGSSDPRVRPLVFGVQWWAKAKELTRSDQPGRWFSNFTTTLLVLFFLMNTNPSPVLEPMNNLFNCSPSEAFTSVLCQASLLPPSTNTESLEELFRGFFDFYAGFDFGKKAISLVTGKAFIKPSYAALYLENPIERHLNVARNVNYEEAETFRSECRLASSHFKRLDEESMSADILDFLYSNNTHQKNHAIYSNKVINKLDKINFNNDSKWSTKSPRKKKKRKR